MAVIRSPLPHASYTALRNCWLRDARVSLKAKGLLGYLASHAEGYKCSQAQMVRESTDGKESIRSGLDELEAAGYLQRVPTRSAGRFAEDDYALTDPFDAAGQLLPAGGRETRLSDAGDRRETRQSGFPASDEPRRQTRPLETHLEKPPVPSGQGAEAAPLTLVPEDEGGPTVEQRAQTLAAEHYEGVGKLVPFLGIRSIVKAALTAGHGDEQIRAALAHLRRTNRTLTKNALGLLLAAPAAGNGHRAVGGNGYGPRGYAPYQDPDPAANPHAFEGPL